MKIVDFETGKVLRVCSEISCNESDIDWPSPHSLGREVPSPESGHPRERMHRLDSDRVGLEEE